VTGVSLGDGVDGETSDGGDGGLVDFSKGRHGLPWRGTRRMDGLEISWQLRHTEAFEERTYGWDERRRRRGGGGRREVGSQLAQIATSEALLSPLFAPL
jgi:hypothetical protein